MKRTIHKLLILFILPIYLPVFSQDLTGIWRGYFTTDDGEQYKLEFQIEQKSNGTVSGVSYSYLDTRFYGKATMTGRFEKPLLSFKIQEIKTVEIKSATGMGACIMNYDFTYARSGKEEFLDGNFLGKTEDRVNPSKHSWGDCGGGSVHLRKVTTSDFYIEPFLRNKISGDSSTTKITPSPNNDGNKVSPKNPPVTTVKPPAKNNNAPLVKKSTPVQNKPAVKQDNNSHSSTKINTSVSKTEAAAKLIDSVQKIDMPVLKNEPVVKTTLTSDVLKTRQNELVKTLIVNDPNVIVKLYDNGEIDGDSISVYLDNKLLLEHKMLTAAPITINLKMDEDNSEHELVMVAENLGRIPPNTSLMIVEAGEKRYSVFISSNEQKNAVVKFKYVKPKQP
jgi:hypothetical protein